MDLKIRGRQALVSGSTKGIGFVTALGWLREGCRVWSHGRSTVLVNDALPQVDILVNNPGIVEPRPFPVNHRLCRDGRKIACGSWHRLPVALASRR